MDTLKQWAITAAKLAGWLVAALAAIVAYGMWIQHQESVASNARIEAMYKPGPQHWQMVNATKSDGPAMWAINVEDGTVMFCTTDLAGTPSCEKENN